MAGTDFLSILWGMGCVVDLMVEIVALEGVRIEETWFPILYVDGSVAGIVVTFSNDSATDSRGGSLADRVVVAGGANVLVRVVCDVESTLFGLHHFSIGFARNRTLGSSVL
jgi:hypothetical protein